MGVMEATESALLRLGSPITSLWFPSVVVFAQPWVLLPPHPELSFHATPQSSKPSLLLTSKRASARLRLSLGTDGGDSVVPPLPEELSLSDRTLSLLTTLQSRRAPPGAWTRGRPTLRPMLTTAMVVTAMDLAMEATAMAVLAMAMADMDWDTDSAMEAMAMAVLATAMADTARGLLTLRPMPTMAMADMDSATDSAMEAMAMAVLATATARGLPTPSPTMVEPTLATAMAVTVLVLVTATATASKGQSCSRELQPLKLTLDEQID